MASTIRVQVSEAVLCQLDGDAHFARLVNAVEVGEVSSWRDPARYYVTYQFVGDPAAYMPLVNYIIGMSKAMKYPVSTERKAEWLNVPPMPQWAKDQMRELLDGHEA
jgi:hypothetical protein